MMRDKNIMVAVLVVCGMIGVGSWLMAAPTTTQSSEPVDLSAAQENLQRMMEQSPPITSPTLPAGEKPASLKKGSTKIGTPLLGQVKSSTNHKLWPEGHYIADRRGRLVKSGEGWRFVFEADGKSMGDPPIKVLPNRWLEKMESDVAASHEALVFQVSGEVTVYHNENYLLLRKVLIERESSSNFR